MTPEALAEAADLSVDMVSKIEAGATGARCAVNERLAAAFKVDPTEFFSTEIASGSINRKTFNELSIRLSGLSDSDLAWVSGVLDAILRPKRAEEAAISSAPFAAGVKLARSRRKERRRN